MPPIVSIFSTIKPRVGNPPKSSHRTSKTSPQSSNDPVEPTVDTRIAALEAKVKALETKTEKQEAKIQEQAEKLHAQDKAHYALDQKVQRFFARYEAEDMKHAAYTQALRQATHPREKAALMRNGLPSEFSQM